jgi:hypothetical protein
VGIVRNELDALLVKMSVFRIGVIGNWFLLNSELTWKNTLVFKGTPNRGVRVRV